MNVLDTLNQQANNLLNAGADTLKAKYLTPGSLSGAPVTVAGNNVPVPAGTTQPVVAATLPNTPTVGADGMGTGQIVLIVLAVLGLGALVLKVAK